VRSALTSLLVVFRDIGFFGCCSFRRHTDSLFAPGDTISDNLKRLAGSRSDIFGSAAEQEARSAAVPMDEAPQASETEGGDGVDDSMDIGAESGRATKRVRTL
jgi:hypothetical protein